MMILAAGIIAGTLMDRIGSPTVFLAVKLPATGAFLMIGKHTMR